MIEFCTKCMFIPSIICCNHSWIEGLAPVFPHCWYSADIEINSILSTWLTARQGQKQRIWVWRQRQEGTLWRDSSQWRLSRWKHTSGLSLSLSMEVGVRKMYVQGTSFKTAKTVRQSDIRQSDDWDIVTHGTVWIVSDSQNIKTVRQVTD